MALKYDDGVYLHRGSLIESGFTPGVVFSWARDEMEPSEVKPVRVQATEDAVRRQPQSQLLAHCR